MVLSTKYYMVLYISLYMHYMQSNLIFIWNCTRYSARYSSRYRQERTGRGEIKQSNNKVKVGNTNSSK